jgi:ParB family transcriptional regulator, chromosome partitioning protein
MTSRRSGLGRGLDALIPNAPAPVAPAATSAGVEEVDIDLIAPNPYQPRTVFDQAHVTELAESIRQHGVIQPLVVSRPSLDTGAPYQLIAGERRLLASREAGLKRVPVIVKEATPQALLELALVENLQRQDLGPLEEAFAFRRLAEEFSLTQEAVATRVGRSRSAVANSIRLLSLSDEMQASLASGEITPGHARALLAIEDANVRRLVWRRIVEHDLTVREAEALAKAGMRTALKRTVRRSADLAAVEETLRGALGTKVELQKGRKGGRVVIHFYSDEELDALIERLSQ